MPTTDPTAAEPEFPAICVVLPVYRPDPGFLRAQLASIAAQTAGAPHVVLVIADGASRDLAAGIARDLGLPHGCVEPEAPLDAPRAFEAGLFRALDVAGPETLVALADQDDIWHPARLARGAGVLRRTGAALVHSDARLIAADGSLIHPSMFRYERRLARPGLRGLLLRNNVTGMTVLMRRSLVARALPLPPQAGVHFHHDLWLALVAEATEGTVLVPEALVDYRQHGANAHGAVDRRKSRKWGPRLRLRRPDAAWLRREATTYALARYLAHSLHNRLADCVQAGLLPPDGARLDPVRPYLRRLRGAGRLLLDAVRLGLCGHGGPARIALGHAVVTAGRGLWSLRQALGPGVDAALDRFDTRLYALSPGHLPVVPRHLLPLPPAATPAPARLRPAAELTDPRKAARFRAEPTAPLPQVNLLVPTLNPTEVFAGILTAVDLGLMLAARGLRVRFIATDLPVASPEASRRLLTGRLTAAQQAAGAAGRIALACGVTSATLPFHPRDRLLATAWWTAHVARGLIEQAGLAERRFHYLIQDHEPHFYSWGPEFADAEASYALDFTPVFNTTLLRDWFAAQGHGFAGPGAPAFHPAIDVGRHARGRRPGRSGPRRLAVYGRPEVPRNMFPTAVEALARFVAARGLGPEQVEVLSVGLHHDPVDLGRGVVMRSLGKLPLEDYPPWLLTVDLGLSLMLSPHPSHPPLEMAASGVRVVTNGFGPKDLGLLTPAILSVPGNAPAVAAGLARAWDAPPVTAAERRIDLSRLGRPLEAVAADLAADLADRPAGLRAA